MRFVCNGSKDTKTPVSEVMGRVQRPEESVWRGTVDACTQSGQHVALTWKDTPVVATVPRRSQAAK